MIDLDVLTSESACRSTWVPSVATTQVPARTVQPAAGPPTVSDSKSSANSVVPASAR